MELWLAIVLFVVCLLIGLVAGFLIARKVFQRQLEKNPPVTRNMIRTMFMQMGRKPSEKDINKVMDTMNVKPPKPDKKKGEKK